MTSPSFASARRAVLCAVVLSLTSLGCTRSVRPVDGDDAGELEDCVWQPSVRVADLPSEPLPFPVRASAAVGDDGTGVFLIPIEYDESAYGTHAYRVDARGRFVSSVFVPDFLAREARVEGDRIAVIGIDTKEAGCVYVEIDTNGALSRRELLYTEVEGCYADRFAISASHLMVRIPKNTGNPSNEIQVIRRADFARVSFDGEELEGYWLSDMIAGDDGLFRIARALTPSDDARRYVVYTTEDGTSLTPGPVLERAPDPFSADGPQLMPSGDVAFGEISFDLSFIGEQITLVSETPPVEAPPAPRADGTDHATVATTYRTFSVATRPADAADENVAFAMWTYERATKATSVTPIHDQPYGEDSVGLVAAGSSAHHAVFFFSHDASIFASTIACE